MTIPREIAAVRNLSGVKEVLSKGFKGNTVSNPFP
jgi:hypothetical protein